MAFPEHVVSMVLFSPVYFSRVVLVADVLKAYHVQPPAFRAFDLPFFLRAQQVLLIYFVLFCGGG